MAVSIMAWLNEDWSLYLVSPFEGKPIASRGSSSTDLSRCHGPDEPLDGIFVAWARLELDQVLKESRMVLSKLPG